MDQNTVDLTKAAITAVAKDAYCDTIQPTAVIAGQTVAGPLALLAVPFRMMGHAATLLLENGNHWLDEKLKDVKPSEQIPPKPNIAAPIIQNLMYNESDEVELRDAFLNLLANSMSKNHANKVHQSFPHLLEEMSPHDAVYLKELYSSPIRKIFPIGKIQLQNDDGGNIVLFTHLASSNYITDSSSLAITIDNLTRLRLIDVSYTSQLSYKDSYAQIENHHFFREIKNRFEPESKITLKRGLLELTTMGKQFASVVLSPPQESEVI